MALEVLEVEAGAETEGVAGMLASVLGSVGEVAVGVEAETWALAVLASVAALWAATMRPAQAAELETKADVTAASAKVSALQHVWQAVRDQHPAAVRDGHFLGMPFGKQDVERRWPRFVQTLGISEQQALTIIDTDATPLLVESDDVAEVLGRLAAISSREKALDLVHCHPALLVGGAVGLREHPGFGLSTLVDVLYAGRLHKVLEEAGRDNAKKLEEIELYSYIASALKPIVDWVHGSAPQDALRRLFRNPLRVAARLVPSSSVRIFLNSLAAVPDPWGFLAGQTGAGLSVAGSLAVQPSLATTILPHSPAILPHLPSIYTRLSILEPHVPGIVRILDPYLEIVEPHLDRIMERMDKIEPHLPYILLHLDVLAKHVGPLLDHFDALLPYASEPDADRTLQDWKACMATTGGVSEQLETCMVQKWTEMETDPNRAGGGTSYLPRLIGYVDFLVPRLDQLAPHLPLVRPHLPYIIPYLDAVLPYVDGFARFPAASKNADVLVGYLGWMLKVPLLPRVLHLPLVPRLIAALSKILPRWPIRHHLERLRVRRELAERLALQQGTWPYPQKARL